MNRTVPWLKNRDTYQTVTFVYCYTPNTHTHGRSSLSLSQWQGSHSFWLYSLNILDQSWSSISKYYHIYINIDIYIIEYILSRPKAVRASRQYYESQNDCIGFSDVTGSSTSTSIWSRLNVDMEEKGIVALDCLLPKPRCPLLGHHRLGSGQRGSGGRQSRAIIPSPALRGSFTSGSQS